MTLFLQHRAPRTPSLPPPPPRADLARATPRNADLAWPHVADMRFDHLDDRTGYLHLAPYVRSDCGVDQRVWGNFARMRDLYSMVR